MESELVSVKDLLIGRAIVDIKEISDNQGCNIIKFCLDNNSVLEMGMKDGIRDNGIYLYSYLSLDGREIYNDVDGQISSF